MKHFTMGLVVTLLFFAIVPGVGRVFGNGASERLLHRREHAGAVEIDVIGELSFRELKKLSSIYGAADRAISAAEVWTKRTLFGTGRDALLIRVNNVSSKSGKAYYRIDEKTIYINLSTDLETVVHETGHAILHRMKPGWTAGVSLVLHEAIADMFVVLTSFRDEETVSIVLDSTGGDLLTENEASRIVEMPDGSALRSALSEATLIEIPFKRDRLRLPRVTLAGSRDDPHRASVVLTGTLYKFLYFRVNRLVSFGMSLNNAIARAADEVGQTMLSAVYLSAEHRITLELYAAALLRAVELVLGDEISSIEMANLLAERGLIAPSFDQSAALTRVHDIADLTIDPDAFDPARFLVDLRTREEELLRIARSTSMRDRWEQGRIPLLFHESWHPFTRCVDSVSFAEAIFDPIATQSGIYVRVEYEYLTTPQTDQDDFVPDPRVMPDTVQERNTAYAGYLFDANGRLIRSHTDRPL